MSILNHFLDGLGLASGVKIITLLFADRKWFPFLRLKVTLISTQLNPLCKATRSLHRLSTASPIWPNWVGLNLIFSLRTGVRSCPQSAVFLFLKPSMTMEFQFQLLPRKKGLLIYATLQCIHARTMRQGRQHVKN